MKKIAFLNLVLLFLFPSVSFADATPFKQRLKINLDFHNSKGDTIQQCCILYYTYEKKLETVCSCDGSTCLWYENNTIEVTRSVPESFQIQFTIGNKKILSPMLRENGMRTQINLSIIDDKITDTTPFFKVPFNDYLLALLLTLLIELAIAALFFIKQKIALKKLSFIVLCNLVSHPILWLTCSYIIGWGFSLFLGETAVILFEGLFLYIMLKKEVKISKVLLLSFVMNMWSYILGGLIYYFFI